MGQRGGIAAILAAAAVCLLLSGVSAYGAYAIVDEDAFADRAASTLKSDEVREEITARLFARVVEAQPRLVGDESPVQDAAGNVASATAFRGGFWTAAVRMHQALFADADADASLRVAGSGADLRAQLAHVPGWSAVPEIDDPSLLAVET